MATFVVARWEGVLDAEAARAALPGPAPVMQPQVPVPGPAPAAEVLEIRT
ncbi:hypothetical protein KCMC57_up46930 [Kitasatospora sp. CMC57]|uniref:Uncharacterized protein n=1 Tax=Kitasatospora sp. CMC57 TaxID=3231513 RepID=A0AB33K3Q2_9ACTN